MFSDLEGAVLKMEFTKLHENPAVLHVGTCPPRSYYLPKAPGDEA